MSQDHENPFDDVSYLFKAVKNAKGQYSLWPDFRAVPQGWDTVFGPAERADCMSYIKEQWADLSAS